MKTTINTETYYTSIQLKLPVVLEKIIEINDPVYTFNEVVSHIDLTKYFVDTKDNKEGRPRYDLIKLLKIILFAFMENGYASVRQIEKLCKTDIRFMWLLEEQKAPSFMTINNFMNNQLLYKLDEIFKDINNYIFAKEKVDLNHIYIDGTKLEANANKYTWVWKKACVKSRQRVFVYITELIHEINETIFNLQGVSMQIKAEYTVEYMEYITNEYMKNTGIDTSQFVYGSGKRKSVEQRQYEKLREYTDKLKSYSKHISTCGEERNSYSKTDNDATFMRIKRDYMGNDQLLPAYNIQVGVCDEYIAVLDVKRYASDMDCFIPLMDKFNLMYEKYPKYPVADAGYGSFNNYLYCEQHGMEKYMKFTMYDKDVNSDEYHDNPFRAVNFKIDEDGHLVCPGGKKFIHVSDRPVRGNKYGRTEEIHQCENCEGCELREKCHKSEKNRIVRLNKELTKFHEEVLENLESVHGALLRMNRSIQAEGTYGIIKWNRSYRRIFRRGINSVILEFSMISCGFNLYKYHLKKAKSLMTA